jgi:photoactive yellow protein
VVEAAQGWAFVDPDLLDKLEQAELETLEGLPFGLITMNRNAIVLAYNRNEARRSGLAPASVIGQDFFVSVGPCTNNYLVAQRFIDEPDLDATLDYVFTFRMAPTPVRLRLLARAGSERQYLAVTDR